VDLDTATTGLVKGGLAGVVPIGTINSYLTIPAGAHRIVAVVTALEMAPARVPRNESGDELAARRVIEAVMVGRLEPTGFVRGIATYPSLFAPVSSATPSEIARIFAPAGGPALVLGEAVVAPDQDVLVDANVLLARHSAVLGSTGAGKTCSVVAIIDGLMELNVPNSNIIIFDANGEYGAAFAPDTARGTVSRAFVIGPEPGSQDGLFLPHWFMDTEDHLAWLRASEGAQAPLLQRAVADARLAGGVDRDLLTQLRLVTRTINDVRELSISTAARKPQEALRALLASLASGLKAYREQADAAGSPTASAFWNGLATTAGGWTGLSLKTGQEAWDQPLQLEQRDKLETLVASIEAAIRSELDRMGLGSASAAADFDAPRYYSLEALNDTFLPARIEREAATEPRIKSYAATLLMRLSRLLADSRYDFLTRVGNFDDALAQYLRYLMGRNVDSNWTAGREPPWAVAYRAANPQSSNHSVTIIDLSLIASDVLETATAMLARLLLSFAQRVSPRGEFPMLLVLEEAHRYVPAVRTEEASRSSIAFERIAKEGRKFGVSLMVSSQRPSELSRTVLAQCGTLIAHRVVNPDDQDLIRHATPFASRDLLNQLPGLATQHAIVLGEAIQVPAYVRVREIIDVPRGMDPDFIAKWRLSSQDDEILDRTARAWEGARDQAGPTVDIAAAALDKPTTDEPPVDDEATIDEDDIPF